MTPEAILAAFPLPSEATVVPVGTGLINKTYRVATREGDFVLQKIHEIIPDAAAHDMQVVTAHLAERGMRVPRLVVTNDGQPFARDDEGGRWRLYPWIAGEIVDALTTEAEAREAGRIVGEMHRHLAALDYRPQGSIPHFHDTAYILDELRGVRDALPSDARALADAIIAELPELIVDDRAGEHRHVIHADLKISNIVFDSGKAVGVIDFDTLLWHYPSVDLGDAYRSWCNRTAEDDAHAAFDMGLFAAAEEGYAQGRGIAADTATRALHLRAAKQIACELASRFLVDVVRDTYFGYDAKRYPSRRAHNLARAAGQYHLATTIPLTP